MSANLCKQTWITHLSIFWNKKYPSVYTPHRELSGRVIASKTKVQSMVMTSILSFMASLYMSVKQRHSEGSCHQINVSLYSLSFPQQLLPLQTGGSIHAQGPSVCTLSGIWDFLKDGAYCVTAAKVMKTANSKLQNEDSCTVIHSTVRDTYMFCRMYQGLRIRRSMRRKPGIKLPNLRSETRLLLPLLPKTLRLNLRLYIFVVAESTKHILPFISAPLRNAVTVLRWKGADLAVLWCSH